MSTNTNPGFTITQEFLETALGKPVSTFTTKCGSSPGDNYCSNLFSVDVTFKGDKTEKHYVIKYYPDNPGRRLDQVNLFKKELFMYADFLPQLNHLGVESGAETNVDLVLAPFHGGNVAGSDITTNFRDTPYAHENFLIMTDIRKTSGFKMADRLDGLDITHTKLVLEELAKFHAASWAYKQKHKLPLLTSKYPTFLYAKHDPNRFKPFMDTMSKKAINAVEEVLGADNPVCKNLRNFLATDLLAVMNDSLREEGIDEEKQESLLRVKPQDISGAKEPWLVLSHADCWVNNLLFRYNANSKPVEVTMVDYQRCRESCPTIDLVYFLCSSVRAPLRIQHEKELLQVYFDAFTKYCNAFKVPTLPGFAFENLQRRYRRAKLYGLVVSLPLLALVLKPKEDSAEVKEEKKEETSSAMFSYLMKEGIKNDLYQMEITATVQNLYDDGVI